MCNTLQDDFEGMSCRLVQVLSWSLFRRTEEKCEERQSR